MYYLICNRYYLTADNSCWRVFPMMEENTRLWPHVWSFSLQNVSEKLTSTNETSHSVHTWADRMSSSGRTICKSLPLSTNTGTEQLVWISGFYSCAAAWMEHHSSHKTVCKWLQLRTAMNCISYWKVLETVLNICLQCSDLTDEL